MKNFIRGFKEGFKDFGHNLVLIINTTLLLVVYFTAVFVTAVVAKITGKKFLEKKLSQEKTYWTDLNLSFKDKDSHYRQF